MESLLLKKLRANKQTLLGKKEYMQYSGSRKDFITVRGKAHSCIDIEQTYKLLQTARIKKTIPQRLLPSLHPVMSPRTARKPNRRKKHHSYTILGTKKLLAQRAN